MAGAFSGHLLNAFNNGPAQPSIITNGAMSFDARAHGTSAPSFPPHIPIPQTLFGSTPFTEEGITSKQIATLQAKLDKKLGPEYISQRPGPGGGSKLTYAEGWKIINLANEVFGFNGWSSSIVNISTDFVDHCEDTRKFNVGVSAIVRVTLRDGAYHEDVGYGMLENGKSKAAALDKCKKEAITDALKRTLRNFGNLLGNCLYDKSYTQEVVKIKVPPAKFDKSELYRRPEFEERLPEIPAPAPLQQAAVPDVSSARREESRMKVEPETPITYIPRHLRQEMAATAQQAQVQTPTRTFATPPQKASTSGSGTTDASANRGPPPIDASKHNGLTTPVQTPAPAQRAPLPRAPLPRTTATSPLVRTTDSPERSVTFAEPVPVPVPSRASSVSITNVDDEDDEDLFPLSTQEGIFFATVDLGEGDLGRPIDYDEGAGGVCMMDTSAVEPELDGAERLPAGPPQSGPWSRSSAGSSGGPVQPQPTTKPFSACANAETSTSTSGGQPQSRCGPPNNASTSSTRAGTPVQDIKRFHPAPGTQKPGTQHVPKSVPASVRTTQTAGPTNALKRSADVMQVGSGLSMRPPIQGMGLAQRQQQQNSTTRRSLDTSDGSDSKRFKH